MPKVLYKGRVLRFVQLASSYANLMEQKKVFTEQKGSTPTGLVCNTKMAAVLLF